MYDGAPTRYYLRKEYEDFKKKHPILGIFYVPFFSLMFPAGYMVYGLFANVSFIDILVRSFIVYIIGMGFMALSLSASGWDKEFQKKK